MEFEIEKFSARINEEITQHKFGDTPFELYEPIRYIMQLGGKRLRPVLAGIANHLYSGSAEAILKPAIAIEVFHNFTLMHDDIMDKAPLRRGKPTVHEKWNSNVAILSGDVMLIRVYDLLLEVEKDKLREIISKFNSCAAEVCEGQQFDMNFESADHTTEAQYLEMIRLKTASLLGFSLEMGAIIGGASLQDSNLLKKFGENIGTGFQLKDDLLDVYANSEKFGKQVGGDILSNKKTFLLIKAIENATGKQAEELNSWLNRKDFDKFEKVNAVTEIYNQLQIKGLTEKKMNEYFTRGFDCLEKVNAPESRKKTLRIFAEKLINREQ